MIELILGRTVNDYELALVIWNIFVAIIPCYIAHVMWRQRGQGWGQFRAQKKTVYLLGFLAWFFFLPNTAYLIAMVRHLLTHCQTYDLYHVCKEGTWIVPLFFLYAMVAVPTFIYALKKMTQVLGGIFGGSLGSNGARRLQILFPAILIPVVAFGLLLGLVDRYNSWEVATRPLDVLGTSWNYLHDPTMLLNWAVYTGVLYVIYYGVPPLFRKVLTA